MIIADQYTMEGNLDYDPHKDGYNGQDKGDISGDVLYQSEHHVLD
jgi:hypothetical protein